MAEIAKITVKILTAGTLNFTDLADALSSYTGHGGKFIKVKAAEDGLEAGSRNVAIGSFTRDVSLASGDQAVTGVGFAPVALVFFAQISGNDSGSWGVDDGTTHICFYYEAGSTHDNDMASNDASIWAEPVNANTYKGIVKSLDSDGFTITWTKGASPTGTLTVAYLAIG